jgi:hypothetical protein
MSGKKALEQFQKIRATRDIISGIHNYCDRWCERCAFTARCSVYAMGEEEEHIREISEEPERDLAEYVGSMLRDAMELLHDMALEHGVDLDSMEDDGFEREKPGKKNYLVRKADEHSKWLIKWLDENELAINEKLSALEIVAKRDFLALSDALEVLKWFMHFIAVKFSRAVLPPFEDTPEGRHDNNGSAKIAILAINRTVDALTIVLFFMPEQEDQLLAALVRLGRIKKRALKDFPESMDFKRPGFDD